MQTSIAFSPKLSDRDLNREVGKIDKRLSKVDETIRPKVDTAGLDGVRNGIGDDRGGGGLGIGGAAGGGALGAALPKPISGVLSSKAVPTALVGGVGVGMLGAMRSASNQMGTSSALLTQAWESFWRPIGDRADEMFIRDNVLAIQRTMIGFEQMAREDGIPFALGTITREAGIDLAKWIWDEATGRDFSDWLSLPGFDFVHDSSAEFIQGLLGIDGPLVSDAEFDAFVGGLLPELETSIPDFSWPSLPSFDWPPLPSFSWPSIPAFEWPSLPAFDWPDIQFTGWNIPTINWDAHIPSVSFDFDLSLPDWITGTVDAIGDTVGSQDRGRDTTIRVPSTVGGGGGTGVFDGGGGAGGVDVAPLRPMARGGVVRSPTRALVGESGPEIVKPLSDHERDLERVARAVSRAGGGQETERIVRAIEKSDRKRDRQLRQLIRLLQDFGIDVDGERLGRVVSGKQSNRINDTNSLI